VSTIRNIANTPTEWVKRVAKLLKGLGIASIVVAIIAGIIQANQTDQVMKELLGGYYESEFRWSVAIYWWISGIISGIVFYALGMMLEYLEDIAYRLRNLEHEANKNNPTVPTPRLGNSKASMSKLEGFKI
jgi:phosphate/sulfate permease